MFQKGDVVQFRIGSKPCIGIVTSKSNMVEEMYYVLTTWRGFKRNFVIKGKDLELVV